MQDYPEILIICSPLECVPPYTLNSLLQYAPHSRTIVNVTKPILMDDTRLLMNRILILEKATAEYVVFLETDDALMLDIPTITDLQSHDIHLFPYYDVEGQTVVSPHSKNVSKLFGFHMTICKKDLALHIMKTNQNQNIYRDDILILYGLLTSGKTIKTHQKPLIAKLGSRLGQYAPQVLRKGLVKELNEVWKPKFHALYETEDNI